MAEVTNNSVTSYDYSMVGSFGSDSVQSLSGETINKMRAAEEKAKLDPIVEDLENWELEAEVVAELQTKVNAFLETIKPLDLFSSSNNAFEQVSASTTGTGAVFDASDIGTLKEGIYVVEVEQIAQKDVWQSSGYTEANSTAALTDTGTFQILDKDGTVKVDITDVNGMTLQEIADQINLSGFASASLAQTGSDEYKLVIKSDDPGTDNALTFSGTSALITDYNDATDTDGDGNPDNHPQAAQNLKATIDGVDYDVSSNSVTLDGNLKITATEPNSTTTLSITQDDSAIVPQVQAMAAAYNEIVAIVSEHVYDSDSPVDNKSGLRDILSGLKNMFFEDYGLNDSNAASYGLEFDRYGLLSVDTSVLGAAITSDYDGVKDFFLGAAEAKGFGTLMKEYLDELNSYDGMVTNYQENMLERKDTLTEEKEETIEYLDTKYQTIADQYVEYAAIIAQMEASFSGLQMMIQQSKSGN